MSGELPTPSPSAPTPAAAVRRRLLAAGLALAAGIAALVVALELVRTALG
jgi:ferric-dicitrate binding protein FerR (iron transport regulator)